MTTRGHTTWIPADALARSWLPAHFEPRFLEMEAELRSDPERFVSLGDVADIVSMWPPKDATIAWVVRRRGEQLAMEAVNDEVKQLVVLPDECLVLHPLVFKGRVATMYWASSIAGGRGATLPTCYALVSRSGADIAWLDDALASGIAQAQLERASAGGMVPLLRHADLADVRVPRPSPQDRVRSTQRARQELVEARNRIVHGVPAAAPRRHVLTGATHEERIDQFERLLFEDGFVAPGSAYYLEQIGDRPDAWVVRPAGELGHSTPATAAGREDGIAASGAWPTWLLEQSVASPFRVFNSTAGGEPLAPPLVRPFAAAAAADLGVPFETSETGQELRLPTFEDFAAAIESAQDGDDLDLDAAVAEVGRLWEAANPGLPLSEDRFAWLRRVFRPVLSIAVHRAGRPVGAFLLQGPDQLEHPADVLALLETQGQQLAAILAQPSEIAEDAARRESIRRLSWMMHQLNGPMMVIRAVIQELNDYVSSNSEVGEALLPDDRRARARAKMNAKPLEDYRLSHRLAELGAAAEGIRRLQYQIRRYKNAQGELQISVFPIRPLLDDLASEARGQLQEATVHVSADQDCWVSADRALIRAALGEVVANACRECRERQVSEPKVSLTAERRGARVQLAIIDNGLPIECSLLDDPFAEDASTYRTQGKGSGLGLAIVKESFARHGGRCALVPNRATDGLRLPGVRFLADLPSAAPTSTPQGDPNV